MLCVYVVVIFFSFFFSFSIFRSQTDRWKRVREGAVGSNQNQKYLLACLKKEKRERKPARHLAVFDRSGVRRASPAHRKRRGLVQQSRTCWKREGRTPLEQHIRCRAAARLTRRDDEPRVVRDPPRAARLRSPSPAATHPREGCWRNSRALPTFEGCRDASFFLDADDLLPPRPHPPTSSVRSDYLFKLLVRPLRACRPVIARSRARRDSTRARISRKSRLDVRVLTFVSPSPKQLIGDSGVGKSCLLLRFAVRILDI